MSWLISVCVAVAVMFIFRKSFFLRTSAVFTLALVIVAFLLNPIHPWIGFSDGAIQLWRIAIRLQIASTFILACAAAFFLTLPVCKALSKKLPFDESGEERDR